MPSELLSVRRVSFVAAPAAVPPDLNRADVACIVGFVRRREGAPPLWVRRWLVERGWLAEVEPGRRRGAPRVPFREPDVLDLRNVAVPVDSWGTFLDLFHETRPGPGGMSLACTLARTVAAFFAEGGRKCYVVRVADPPAIGAARAARLALVDALSPLRAVPPIVAADPTSWRGLGQVLGVAEASMLLLPDLPELFAGEPEPLAEPPLLPQPREVFAECAAAPVEVPPRRAASLEAPRFAAGHYEEWAARINEIAGFLRRNAPDVQLLAAVPLAQRGGDPRDEPPAVLSELLSTATGPGPLATSFVQLVYPWIAPRNVAATPEGIEPADGALSGVLARLALSRGTHRSATDELILSALDVVPALTLAQRSNVTPNDPRQRTFLDRVASLGRTADGIQLLSDVTPAEDDAWRPGAVHRLVNVVIRAARRIGEDLVFESSGEQLWELVRERMTALLEVLREDGAFGGLSPADAYEVRCGRDTMTQADLDAGRVIATVALNPAAPLERITVTLAVDVGGAVTILDQAAA